MEQVIRDDRPSKMLAEFDLRFVFLEIAAAHQECAADGLDGMKALPVVVPLNESAIAEAYGALAVYPGDLIARPPEGTIDEPHGPSIGGVDAHHGRVRAVKGDELAVGNQQRHRSAILDHQGGKTVVGADAEEISVANSGLSFDEFVTDVIPETKGVVSVLPIASSKNKSFAMSLLPGEKL